MLRLFSLLLLATPAAAYASSHRNFAWLVDQFLGIINLLIPFVFGLSLLVFLWGIMQAWILSGGDQLGIDRGKRIALAGIIGLVVMTAVWGIVALVSYSLFDLY